MILRFHRPSVRLAKISEAHTTDVGGDAGERDSHSMFAGLQTGTGTMKVSVENSPNS